MIYLVMGIITNKFYRQVDKELFDINVFGPVHLSRLIIPHFAERGNALDVINLLNPSCVTESVEKLAK